MKTWRPASLSTAIELPQQLYLKIVFPTCFIVENYYSNSFLSAAILASQSAPVTPK
jgi:hypothetical protein